MNPEPMAMNVIYEERVDCQRFLQLHGCYGVFMELSNSMQIVLVAMLARLQKKYSHIYLHNPEHKSGLLSKSKWIFPAVPTNKPFESFLRMHVC